MEWIKKNWKWLAVAVIVLIVVLYFINKKRVSAGKEKISLVPGATARRVKKKEEEKQVKIQSTEATLVKCEEAAKSVRLKAGAPHPCVKLRTELASLKGTESKFTGPWTKTNGLNVMDYAMGLEGMSLLEDKDLNKESGFLFSGCRGGEYPNPTTGRCGEKWDWDQYPAGVR